MEEGWNVAPILIPLVALLIGWAMGFFDSNMRTSKKIKQAEESAQAAIKDAEDQVAQIRSQLTTGSTSTADDPGLMRIKNNSGEITLELDGTRVNSSNLTPEQRKRLIELLNIARPWLEGKPATSAPSMTMTPPHPAPKVDATSVASPAPQPKTAPVKKGDEPEAPPTSIVGQINLILQARIVNTPLASRGLVLLESPSGGVNVYIGTNKYEGVDTVPDEEIKAAIREAIAEWEKKYTPGLS